LPFSRFEVSVPKPLKYNLIENPVTVGEMMRNRRLQLRLFQKEVAKLMGADEATIYHWENNKYPIHRRYNGKIIKFLGYYPFPLDLKTLGGRIQCYLNLHGCTHEDFAKLVGVDESTVTLWRRNKKKPLKRSLPKVLECLKCVEPLLAAYKTEEKK